MELGVRSQSLKQFRRRMKRKPFLMAAGLQKVINQITMMTLREAKDVVRGKVGNIRAYKTGNLMKKIVPILRPLEGIVKSNAKYSIYVHEGTRYMRARPFFTVATQNISKKAEEVVQLFVKTVLKK